VQSWWKYSLQCEVSRDGALQPSVEKSQLARPFLEGSMSEKSKKYFKPGAWHAAISIFLTIFFGASTAKYTVLLVDSVAC